MTRSERLVWSRIRSKQFQGLKFRRQHGVGPYIVDFYCPERGVVIEIDGDVHAGEAQVARDQRRENYLRSLGLRVIRYMNDDVLNRLDAVFEDLWEKLTPASTSPLSPPYIKGGET
ncbi:MAG: endonuclease domain-containing protein [Deltaproteobacteria bacterium]|nr:endonuclease domain-containing protein [Deltaproteobacteria bacterium]